MAKHSPARQGWRSIGEENERRRRGVLFIWNAAVRLPIQEKKMVLPYTMDISDERLATIRAKVKAYDWSQLPDTGAGRRGSGWMT